MSGTKIGGQRSARTQLAKDPDFFKKIGRIGGSRSTPNGGFASSKVGADGLTGRERAKKVGAVGGRKSTRLGVKNGEGKKHRVREDADIEEAERILEEESRNGRDSSVA